MIDSAKMVVYAGRSNPGLARKICRYLDNGSGSNDMVLNSNFSDGEVRIEFKDNIRLRDVFLIQSTNQPDQNLIELLLMIDAAKRASAARITAVIPYFGYGRQDRKDESRAPIAASLMIKILVAAGANRIITMDLHAGQIQGFADIPIDNLYGKPVLVKYVLEYFAGRLHEVVVASPDVGGIKRARAYAKKINNAPLVIVDKRRPQPNAVEVVNIIGEVKNKIVLVIDDIIDTAGTFVDGAKAIVAAGAQEVYGVCTHPVLSGGAVDRLISSPVNSLLVTDTISLSNQALICPKIKVVSVANIIAEAMLRSRTGESVSDLFN